MKREQKVVATGALIGVVVMILLWLILAHVLESLPADADAGERLAYAAKWDALAALPLFVAIIAVGNARFASDAIDPTAGKESRAMIVNGRMVDNTVQQYALFFAATLALAAASRGDQLALVASAAIVFVMCRLVFWIGYRIDPLHRAAGFASTAYLNMILFGVALWRAWT